MCVVMRIGAERWGSRGGCATPDAARACSVLWLDIFCGQDFSVRANYLLTPTLHEALVLLLLAVQGLCSCGFAGVVFSACLVGGFASSAQRKAVRAAPSLSQRPPPHPKVHAA